jgi:ribosome biogenesis ATPase
LFSILSHLQTNSQGSNNLNKSVQGLWTAQRKKINLNAPTPSLPADENPVPEQSESKVDVADASVDLEAHQPTVNAKRRLRTAREEGSKRPKISSTYLSTPPSARLSDLGGIDGCVEKMMEFVVMPLRHPEVYLHTGVQPPRGVLLHGPPGCGKTMLANAIAGVSKRICITRKYLTFESRSSNYLS